MLQGSYQVAAIGATPALDAGAGNTVGGIMCKVFGPLNAVVQLQTSPDGTTWTTQDTVGGSGSGYGMWAGAALNHRQRQIRANVTNLGTGGLPVGVVLQSTA